MVDPSRNKSSIWIKCGWELAIHRCGVFHWAHYKCPCLQAMGIRCPNGVGRGAGCHLKALCEPTASLGWEAALWVLSQAQCGRQVLSKDCGSLLTLRVPPGKTQLWVG
jgi:hypothetical protein